MNNDIAAVATTHCSVTKMIYFFCKRLFDITVGFVGLYIVVLFSLIIKIVSICRGDFNSIFYKQRRVGKNGKILHICKFRTMVPNADEVLKELLKDEKYKKEWDEYQKLDKDPRITPIGRFLRKTSLDEIPQFINVFFGDMSLIGPRPLVEGELDKHKGNHEIYESVRPGVTSWWAVNGRSEISYKKRLELEYYYVKNMGFKLDFKCILKTIKVVIFGDGAK